MPSWSPTAIPGAFTASPRAASCAAAGGLSRLPLAGEADGHLALDDLRRLTGQVRDVVLDVLPGRAHRLLGTGPVREDADTEAALVGADQVVALEPGDAPDHALHLALSSSQ